MFATTLTLTIDGVDKVLNRVNQDNGGSRYTMSSDTEFIEMQVRHSTDKVKGQPDVQRHNVYLTRTIYATPTAYEKFWSVTYTLRDRVGSGPSSLLHLSTGAIALIGAMDNDLVVGIN